MEFLPRLYDNAPTIWILFRGFMNKKLKIALIAQSLYWNVFILLVVLVNTVIVIYYFVDDSGSVQVNNIN